MTYFKFHKTIALALLITVFSWAQEKQNIRLGVKNIVPNQDIETLIANNNYNYIDAFEYELTKLLIEYSNNSDQINLQLIPVAQSDKSSAIKEGTSVDALLFTYSETPERITKDNIVFSIPYFQNRAMAIITNNAEINVETWKNKLVRIGHVSNTTAQKELQTIKNRHNDNVLLYPFPNHEELINALRQKDIDAAAGDVSRLVYEVNEGDIYFGGNLPTKRSKIKDNYCIGIAPGKVELKTFFDNFISNSEKQIKNLEGKWLETALNDAYGSYYSKTEAKLKNTIKYILGGAAIILLLFGFWVIRKLKKKDEIIKEKGQTIADVRAGRVDIQMGKMMSHYEIKIQEILNADEIAEAGCNFFEEAESNITYVGSGGFLSDVKFGERWSKSLNSFLDRGGIFERVVDLPAMLKTDNGIRFVETDNFLPFSLEKNYISRFLNWVFIQHCNLITHKKLTIINSRGAALWGYGIVIMIKDNKEVLIFTTDKKEKWGTVLPNNRLAAQIANVISEIRLIGEEVNCGSLMDQYFSKDSRLSDIISDVKGRENALTKDDWKNIKAVFQKIEDEFHLEKRHSAKKR